MNASAVGFGAPYCTGFFALLDLPVKAERGPVSLSGTCGNCRQFTVWVSVIKDQSLPLLRTNELCLQDLSPGDFYNQYFLHRRKCTV